MVTTVTQYKIVTKAAPAPAAKTVTAPPVTVYKTITPAPAPAAAAPPAAAGPAGSITDGTFVVGTDIATGTWHTDGTSGMGCYWEKDKDLSGTFDAVIANDNFNGPVTITIDSSVKAFKTAGGCAWTRTG